MELHLQRSATKSGNQPADNSTFKRILGGHYPTRPDGGQAFPKDS